MVWLWLEVRDCKGNSLDKLKSKRDLLVILISYFVRFDWLSLLLLYLLLLKLSLLLLYLNFYRVVLLSLL